jgi:hypothetical protein
VPREPRAAPQSRQHQLLVMHFMNSVPCEKLSDDFFIKNWPYKINHTAV